MTAEPIGHRMPCGACGREVVRIATHAPFPHREYAHVDGRPCGGPRAEAKR